MDVLRGLFGILRFLLFLAKNPQMSGKYPLPPDGNKPGRFDVLAESSADAARRNGVKDMLSRVPGLGGPSLQLSEGLVQQPRPMAPATLIPLLLLLLLLLLVLLLLLLLQTPTCSECRQHIEKNRNFFWR